MSNEALKAKVISAVIQSTPAPVRGLSLNITEDSNGVHWIVFSNAEMERLAQAQRLQVWNWAKNLAQRLDDDYSILVGVGRQ